MTFYIDSNVPEMGDDPADEMPYGTDVLYTDAANGEEDLRKYYDIWECYANGQAVDPPAVTDNSYGYNYTVSRRFWMRRPHHCRHPIYSGHA